MAVSQNIRLYKVVGRRAARVNGQGACGVSQSINPGDPVVKVLSGGLVYYRKIVLADFTADYVVGSSVAGIYGIARHFCYTDANGYAGNQPAAGGASASSQPVFQIPNYAAGFDPEPLSGYSRLSVWVADDQTEFRGKVDAVGGWLAGAVTGASGTVANRSVCDSSVEGQLATFNFASTGASQVETISVVGNVVNSVTTVADDCPIVITGIDESYSQETAVANASTWVRFRFLRAFQQELTGILYSS